MEHNPLITAIVTTYDRPRLAQRAIRSAFAQTYAPLEILIIEDGTDSGVESWLQREKQGAVRYVRHHQNQGLAAARNTGLAYASGDYIAYLDDDDEWKPNRLAEQVKLLSQLSSTQRERTGVIYCTDEIRYPDATVVADASEYNSGELRSSILKQHRLTTPSSSYLFEVEALRDVGGFDEQLTSSIDHDIWMALADAGYHAYFVDEPLVVKSKEGQATMVTDSRRRINGILQFVEKWRPVLKEWMGEDQGDAFAEQYIARVMAKLAGEQAAAGEWKEMSRVFAESFRYSNQPTYNLRVNLRSIGGGVFRRTLSPRRRSQIKQVLSPFLSLSG
jgi:glycosyltransferase involved in cell wall biosynthesis